jgi:hypothetical protein
MNAVGDINAFLMFGDLLIFIGSFVTAEQADEATDKAMPKYQAIIDAIEASYK